MPVESSEPEVPGLCDYARNDEVEDQTLCGEYRDVTPSQHITSSTGARRCDTWAKRLSISPSRPSSSYRLMVRRKVRGIHPATGPHQFGSGASTSNPRKRLQTSSVESPVAILSVHLLGYGENRTDHGLHDRTVYVLLTLRICHYAHSSKTAYSVR